ncbi:MAG: S9 family peptidase, partial [Chloroflexi bacterium]|nr:S9 family peptidase [Chloroflexota bacterium]
FTANRRHRGQFDLYRQPYAGGDAEMLWQHDEPGYPRSLTYAPTGDKIAFTRMSSSFQHDIFLLDVTTNEVQQLNPPDKEAQFTALTFSKDGRFLIINTNLGTDFRHIATYDLQEGTWQKLIRVNWDTEHMELSPNGRLLAYTVNEAGVSTLYVYDLETGEDRTAPVPDTAPGVVGWYDEKLTFSPDSKRLAFSYTSAVRTSDIFVWDVEEGGITAVTHSSHGGIPTTEFATPELITFPTFDQRDIPAWYFQPTHSAQPENGFPVVVIVHGGPESQFRPYFNFLAQYLVHHGYAVLATNVRGSTGYGKAFSHLDNVEKRMDSVSDLAHAAQWLKQQSNINSDKIVVYGGSYGGFMVLAAITHYPALWAAAVNIVGISNFVTFLENTSDYRRVHREAEYGSLAKDRDFLQHISPLNYVDNITAPVMVIHGANDPRVPVTEAEQLVAKLEQRNIPVELLVFDDEGHGIAKLKNKLVLYPAIAQFLNTHLG